MDKYAVKVGYAFNLFSAEDLSEIELEMTTSLVAVDGIVYPLYHCLTFEGSRKVDGLLDKHGEYEISDYHI